MKVLVFEDDRVTAQAVADVLAREGVGCDCAANVGEGLRRAATAAYDLVIMDRMLPDMSGTAAIPRLREAGFHKPVLMLSALGRTEHRVEGLDAGADDYLSKPFEPEELVARVRALHRRGAAVANQPFLVHGDVELNVKARTVHRAGRHVPLSPKEFELLKYLMEHAGEIVTRQMLLLHVWNLNFDPQTNVIDVHLVRIRRKLDEGFAASWLETVRGQGYRLRPTSPA